MELGRDAIGQHGGIGGDAGDELAIKGAVVEKNTFAKDADKYVVYHKLIGGKRGQFKVTVDGESIDPVVEETPGADDNTGAGDNTGTDDNTGTGDNTGAGSEE